MTTAPISGAVAPGWEGVRVVFADNFEAQGDVGASVAIVHRGRTVVDLRGGWFDERRTIPYDDTALQLVFSATKGITSVAVAICVERGWLDYDAPVVRWWPEFGACGKSAATVAQLLSHQVGLLCPDEPVPLDVALRPGAVAALLADSAPSWPIGSSHGYHALTFGWLAAELVRRADPAGRTIGRFVRDEIAAPLGEELWIGLPPEHEHRVSPLITPSLAALDPTVRALVDQLLGPGTPAGTALTLRGAFSGQDEFNRPDVHAAEIPAANGITTARALARMYAATIGEVDGVRLVAEPTMARARTAVTPEGEADRCLMMPTSFAMGFMTYSPFTPFAGAGSYGHPGMGGSCAFAQPARDLALAYVMNRMATTLVGDARAQRLIDAAVAAADGTA